MGFHPTASDTFVCPLSLIPHAFLALRAMFVALGLSRCMFSLPYFRLRSLPLLSPLLLSVVSVGFFRALFMLGAAQLRFRLAPAGRNADRAHKWRVLGGPIAAVMLGRCFCFSAVLGKFLSSLLRTKEKNCE